MAKLNMCPSFAHLNEPNVVSKPRPYLGMSGIGECDRATFYAFRWYKKVSFPQRILHLFRLGHIIEDEVIKYLKKSGFEIVGEQHQFKDFDGVLKGHCDFALKGFKECPEKFHMADVKSFNDARFKAWREKGVKLSDPKYYNQLTLYAGYGGLEDCVLIGYNKNTSEIAYERFKFSKSDFVMLKSRIKAIIENKYPPDRIADKMTSFKCKFCDFKEICWMDEKPERNCRTCLHFNTVGGFKCGNEPVSIKTQEKGCVSYEQAPPF